MQLLRWQCLSQKQGNQQPIIHHSPIFFFCLAHCSLGLTFSTSSNEENFGVMICVVRKIENRWRASSWLSTYSARHSSCLGRIIVFLSSPLLDSRAFYTLIRPPLLRSCMPFYQINNPAFPSLVFCGLSFRILHATTRTNPDKARSRIH